MIFKSIIMIIALTTQEIFINITIFILYCLYFYQQFSVEEKIRTYMIIYEIRNKYPKLDEEWENYDPKLQKDLFIAFQKYKGRHYEFKNREEKMAYFNKHLDELLYYVYFRNE